MKMRLHLCAWNENEWNGKISVEQTKARKSRKIGFSEEKPWFWNNSISNLCVTIPVEKEREKWIIVVDDLTWHRKMLMNLPQARIVSLLSLSVESKQEQSPWVQNPNEWPPDCRTSQTVSDNQLRTKLNIGRTTTGWVFLSSFWIVSETVFELVAKTKIQSMNNNMNGEPL